MRTAIIGSKNIDSMESNILESLIYLGHECEIFDMDSVVPLLKNSIVGKYVSTIDKISRIYSDSYDIFLFKKLASRVLDFNPELVICVYRNIHPIFVSLLKKSGCRVIHINPDQMVTLGYQQIFASDYDAWFVKDRYMMEFMKQKMKLNVFLYNEAFNHRLHIKPNRPKSLYENLSKTDVMTYGTFYPYRTKMLKILVDSGIDLKVYGVVPNRFYDESIEKCNQHKYITCAEKAEKIYGAKIVFNQMHYAEVESVNCRFFEVNGCGGFQISDYKPILKELLPIDPELVSFRNIDEGVDKIKYYLSHPEERYELSDIIYHHFIQHYTYDDLMIFILSISM